MKTMRDKLKMQYSCVAYLVYTLYCTKKNIIPNKCFMNLYKRGIFNRPAAPKQEKASARSPSQRQEDTPELQAPPAEIAAREAQIAKRQARNAISRRLAGLGLCG